MISSCCFLFDLFSIERIPVNDKYKIHKAFDRQIQSFGGTTLSNFLKELISKGARPHEGEVNYLFKSYNNKINLIQLLNTNFHIKI